MNKAISRGWAVIRAETILATSLSRELALQRAFCSKEPRDFNTSEEWFIYRDNAIRDGLGFVDNPYRISEVEIKEL